MPDVNDKFETSDQQPEIDDVELEVTDESGEEIVGGSSGNRKR